MESSIVLAKLIEWFKHMPKTPPPPPGQKILSVSEKQKFADWLNQKTVMAKPCPVCGQRHWFIVDHVLEVRPFSEGSLIMGGPVYPYVAICCSNCGNTQFINAMFAGVLEENGQSGKEGAPSPDPETKDD